MRIIGGRLRGRPLSAPDSQAIRPTSDRLRESVFNILHHSFEDPCDGARVIDLFAGTGALGFEAISRGATHALFVDDAGEARALLRSNTEALGLGGITRIFRRDATRLGKAPASDPFTLAFLDPPYRKGLATRSLQELTAGGWLADEALCVIEEAADITVELPPSLTLRERRAFGETQIVFAQLRTIPSP